MKILHFEIHKFLLFFGSSVLAIDLNNDTSLGSRFPMNSFKSAASGFVLEFFDASLYKTFAITRNVATRSGFATVISKRKNGHANWVLDTTNCTNPLSHVTFFSKYTINDFSMGDVWPNLFDVDNSNDVICNTYKLPYVLSYSLVRFGK